MKKRELTDIDYFCSSENEPEPNIFQKIWWRFFKRIPDWLREIKWITQAVFRRNHASDRDIWELSGHLVRIILPKLKAFRSSPLHGHPIIFCDWGAKHDPKYGGMGMTKKQYDAAKKRGEYLGGGFKAWLKAIDEMIFAFEYAMTEDDDKKLAAFFKKYKMRDPHAKTKANAYPSYVYEDKESGHRMMSSFPPEKTSKNYKLVHQSTHYYSKKDAKALYDRAQNGFELFGKHFRSLWD